jgi:2-C-methyl-D-erythritol 4-phosphate cytidylyltransferase
LKKNLIIVAGGTGTRIKSEIPKQFIELCGKPVIVHTLQKFLSYDPDLNIIVVCHKDYYDHFSTLAQKYFPGKTIRITEGGETRFHSVKNGLALLDASSEVVAIHDAARPLVDLETIKNCFETAEKKGNAIPVIAVNESLRQVESSKNKMVKRTDFRIIQTPQCFQLHLIKKAFEQNYNETFTDDASVLEKAGHDINLVEGNSDNIKITTALDLKIAEALLK